jgi:ubiquinone biosynthesis protein Coq4
MPERSLGRELVNFLQTYNLNMLPWYETHDIKHLLLGYPPDEKGEVSLQFFMLGNRHYSPAVWLTVITGLLTMPEYYKAFYKAWKRGRSTPPIEHTNWNALITQPVTALRKQLFISQQ